MKNVIYQYWDGPMNPCIEYSKEQFKNYADKIGCDYIFEHNPKYVSNLGKYSPHYGAFKPVFESSFDKYDNVMFVDSDVFPVNNIEENIFSEFAATGKEIGICEEWNAPKVRTKYQYVLDEDINLLFCGQIEKTGSFIIDKIHEI